ncbi:MAG TPA: PKD domain-containing protein, partial [Bacteroidia bacterium]|nr:PKD domain-containing protein [Bacteroidia bacterium]
MKTGKILQGLISSLAKRGLWALLLFSWVPVLAQNPSASFTSNVFSGCAPMSVDFTNLSSNATAYMWDFGNGNTSVLQDPTTVYLTPGYYTVTLIAINTANGLRDTLVATNFIHVVDDPIPDFTANPLSGCAGNNFIAFTNLSVNATSYIWDFGDGTFSTQSNPVHNYAVQGTYTVKLIARNAFSCTKVKVRNAYITIAPNPPASFTVNQQSSCDPSTLFLFNATTPGAVAWQWDFGDGTTSTIQNPGHVYGLQGAYDVSLIVTNASGCTDTIIKTGYITIGASLVPSITVNSQTGCPPFNAVFDCTVPNATSWQWDFGDGTTSTLQNPTHLYSTSGSYTVTITVTTTSGCNGTAVFPGYIMVDALPVPSFTVNTLSRCSPVTALFTNTSTAASTYSWTFGNGTTSTDTNATVVYTAQGTYAVTLTAYSANGCSASISDTDAVKVYDITANINGTPRIGCAPLPVTANGTSVPTAVSWFWDFGDGTTGTGASFPHVYNNIGNYTVTLIAISAEGCSDTVVKPAFFKVVSDTTAYTVPDTMIVCTPPGTVGFTDPTIGSNSWVWYWGNGDSSTVKNPSYTYTVPGVYTVTLHTGMAGGCTQVINPIAYVKVVPFIISPITSVITSPCGPYTVQLNNLTAGVASYLWSFGDGTTSTIQNPVHTYANPGTYTISLQITSINGCLTSLSTSVTFGHNNPIVVSDDSLCLSTPVSFSLNPAAAFTAATWNFGDGTTLNGLSPTYSYSGVGSYQVSVTVTDTNGCVNTYTYPDLIEVTNPQASFVVNQLLTGCTPFNVQFDNTSTGAVSYLWDFGDGTTSTLVSPTHTYTVAGTYTISLTASAPGCDNVFVQNNYITVNAAIANFSFTPTTGCLPLAVTFTDNSVAAVSWFWDFGDGSTSTIQNPLHTFLVEPTGSIALTIVDSNGCTKTKRKSNVDIIKPDIQASDSIGCRPLTVNFSTSLAAVTYLWDFGDGNTSSVQNPTHIYNQTGLFTVSLTCTLSGGCVTTTVKDNYIQVSAPAADFMTPTIAVCAPSLVNFVDLSTGAVAWLWNFGDGSSSSSQNPSHIFNSPGTYTITLIAFSSTGCTDTLVKTDYIVVPGTLTTFAPSDTVACENSSIQFTDQSLNASQWFWDFGDGTTSALQNPSHNYLTAGSYAVTLITNDSVGCSSFYTYPSQIVINPLPVASGTVSNTSGCVSFATSFGNNSTGAVTYLWNFGDGGTSTDSLPSYTYNAPGNYQVTLIATTSLGCSDTAFVPGLITVYATPSANFLRSVNSGCAPLAVSFTDQSTSLNGATYFWDFGNGFTSTSANPSTNYLTAGVYTVSLTVTNTGGCTSTITKNITVNPSPSAQASVSGTSGCSPFTVNFTNNSTGATSYQWNFGNGAISTVASPNYTYTTGGSYPVTLIALTSNGCTDTLQLPAPITVNQTPVAAFTASSVSGCAPVNVSLTNLSSQLSGPAYTWNFGNGLSSNGPSPSYNYTVPGTYTLTLVVTNSSGCVDSTSQVINVLASPVVQATVSASSGCSPLQVTFNNSSTGASNYSWNFGNGTTSTLANPSVIYTAGGTFPVTLTATAANGCVDTLHLVDTIKVEQSPVASFVRTPTAGCIPVNV